MTMRSVAEASDERRLLRESAADYVARAITPKAVRAARDEPGGFDRRRLREIAGFGWIGLAVPEALGGLGLGCGERVALHDELGGGPVPEPVAVQTLAADILAASGDAARDWLPHLLSGDSIATVAWQGAPGAERAGQTGCEAVRKAEGWSLSGRAVFVPIAGVADLYLVAARTSSGVAVFAVPADAKGLAFATRRAVDFSTVGTLSLDAVTLGAEACLVDGAAGETVLEAALDRARVAAAAEICGAMGKALEMTLSYMRTRVQFGKPIGSFQAQQHKAVDLFVQLELARASAIAAADAMDAALPEAGLRVAAAKARASDAGIGLGGRAIHLHGAIGITEEYDLGLYLRRIHFLGAWLGNGNAMRRRYARLSGIEAQA